MPTLLQFFVKMTAGSYSDKNTSLSETLKVRIFNSIAFGGMATCFILLAILPMRDMPSLALFLLICSAAILGFNVGGFFKSSTLVSRQYSYFVNTNVQVSLFYFDRKIVAICLFDQI